jgi:hypothetical protein
MNVQNIGFLWRFCSIMTHSVVEECQEEDRPGASHDESKETKAGVKIQLFFYIKNIFKKSFNRKNWDEQMSIK